MSADLALRPVDSVDVTILVDNSIDLLLAGDSHAIRPTPVGDWMGRPQLRAEHGFAALVTVRSNGAETSLLYDAGLTGETLLHNLSVLGVSLRDIQSIVLSHGHSDHHGGLEGVVRAVGRPRVPLILHPEAWKSRTVVFPTGAEMNLPPPDPAMLRRADVELLERAGPSYLVGDTVLVSGRVERESSFERGFPLHYAQGASGWAADPMIWDDQNLICHVKGRGLVVVSSCSHAGVVNILRNAQRRTGVDHVHAFVGGLHLTGAVFEPVIAPTMDELERIQPEFVVPGHCTGWRARVEIGRRMPSSYLESSVGTRFHFG